MNTRDIIYVLSVIASVALMVTGMELWAIWLLLTTVLYKLHRHAK